MRRISFVCVRSLVARALSGCALITALLLSALASSALGQSRSYELGERLGAAILPGDRYYFGLFPNIEDFGSAALKREGNGGLTITIAREHHPDTVLALSSESARELSTYVGKYERLFLGENDLKWKLIKDIATLRQPFTDNPIVLTVTTRSGEATHGSLLYISDSALVIGPSPGEVLRSHQLGGVRTLLVGELASVRDERGFLAHRFSELDVPVSGNDTIFVEEVLPALRGRALFQPLPSPEIARAIDRRRSAMVVEPALPVEELEARRDHAKLHLLLTGRLDLGWTTPSPVSSWVINGPKADLTVLPPGGGVTLGIEYSLWERLRLGLAYTTHAPSGAVRDTLLGYERLDVANAFEGTVRGVLIRHRDFMRNMAARLEVTAGAGVSIQPTTLGSGITYEYSAPRLMAETSESRTLVGGVAMMGLSYYLAHSLSIDLEGRYSVYPEIDVPDRLLLSRFSTEPRARHDTYTLNLSGGAVLIGLRVHL